MLGTFDNNPMYGLNVSSKLFDGVNRYVRITDIDDDTHDLVSNDICSPSSFTKNYLLSEGDLLFARTGASVGKTYLYNSIHGLQYFAGYLIKFHFKDNLVAKYVFYSTQTTRYKNWVNVFSKRSGQPGINSEEYSKFEIYLPKSNELKKILSFFELLERKIQIVDAKCEALKKYRKGIQKIAFRLAPNEAYVKFKSLVSFMPKSKLSAGNSIENGKYPFYLSGEKIGTINSFMYEGYYIIANDGGEAGFRMSNGPFAYSDHCICFRSENEWATRNLYEYLDSQKDRITYVGFLGSGLKNIDRAYLQNFGVPSTIRNKKLAILFSLLDKKIQNLKNKSIWLKAAKRYLLANMFI